MEMEKIVEKIADHDSRIKTLEKIQIDQKNLLCDIQNRIDNLVWAVVLGEGAIIILLIGLLTR